MTIGNIAFIGARGAGKSKITRRLSKQIGRALMNVDQLICYENNGASIANIVQELGWPAFRDLEFKVLNKVCEMENVVIDCGGGILVEAPTSKKPDETFSNRKANLLKKRTTVIYIKRDWDWMIMKSGINSSRPDLGGEYKTLLEKRLPWYEKSADFILDMQNNTNITKAVEQLVLKYFS